MRKKLLSSFFSLLIALTIFVGSSLPVHAASKYHLWVNLTENVVLVYENDTHIKSFICSTGNATPKSGTYGLSTKYRWGCLKGYVWGQYCTVITGNFWFHSVPYVTKNASDLEYWEYDKLGTTCSAGCVRLTVEDAKWIYENCPSGTPCTFYSGSDIGTLPKPTAVKLSNCPSDYRGWDPTDPNSSNPWNNDDTYTKNTFDADQYLKYNPGLKDTVGTDTRRLRWNWISEGIPNKRRASDDFSIDFFTKYYPEFESSFGTDYYSYVSYYNRTGKSAGYIGSEKDPALKYVFDPVYYANEYPDVKKAFGNDADKLWNHYITNGIRENRSGSSVFNLSYYKSNNTDLKNAFGDNTYKYFRHFINNGMREGRQAIDSFNVFTYMDANPDLKSKFGTDYKKYYTHYIGLDSSSTTSTTTTTPAPETTGAVTGTTIYNGVDYSKVYDFTFYEEHNPDVKKAFGSDDAAALRHFVTNGMKEGRQAISTFDVMCYKSLNADLRKAFGDDLVSYYYHYMNQGYKEGRTCVGEVAPEGPSTVYNGVDYSKVYDYNYYIEHNPDVKKAFGSDSDAALKHFVLHGMAEGRQAIEGFNVYVYKDLNKDLNNAFGDDLARYYMHYITQGYKEGRTCA